MQTAHLQTGRLYIMLPLQSLTANLNNLNEVLAWLTEVLVRLTEVRVCEYAVCICSTPVLRSLTSKLIIIANLH